MRIIARLDIKNNFVIKGINLEGLRKIGDPEIIAKNYYELGVDELLFIDAVASLYKRNNIFNILKNASKNIFIPLTIGGGIRNLNDIYEALNNGADRVAINTAALENKSFLKKAVIEFGSSTIISYIEAKNIDNNLVPFKNTGRDRSNYNLVEWINIVQEQGVGEIILTSIDYEGMQKGFDVEMIETIYENVNVPLVISGGCGTLDHILNLKQKFENINIALASALHYKKIKFDELKKKV